MVTPAKNSAAKKPVKKAAKKPAPKREPKPVGHPVKLTPELRETLIGAIRIGTPLGIALGYSGVSADIIRKWRTQAEAAKKVKYPSKELQGFVEFFRELDSVLHEATVRAQRAVHYLFARDIAKLTPEEQRIALQAAQFHLTHRNSKDYNTRTTNEIIIGEQETEMVFRAMSLALSAVPAQYQDAARQKLVETLRAAE